MFPCNIFAVFFIIWILNILVNVKLDVNWQKRLPFKVGDFIGLLNFKWHSQNKVANIGILVLWKDCEKKKTHPGRLLVCRARLDKRQRNTERSLQCLDPNTTIIKFSVDGWDSYRVLRKLDLTYTRHYARINLTLHSLNLILGKIMYYILCNRQFVHCWPTIRFYTNMVDL